MTLVLRSVRLVGGQDGPVDVVLEDGRIARVVPAGADIAGASAEVLDLDGRWAMPGLADNHAHFTTWAHHLARADVSGTPEPEAAVERVRQGLAAQAPGETLTFVGRGFQDALWTREATARMLDDVAKETGHTDRPIVLYAHDLHTVWLSSAAAARFGAPRAGLVREAAAFAVEKLVDAEAAGSDDAVVAGALQAAAARGVTRVSDMQMADNPLVWASRVPRGLDSVRVIANVYLEHLGIAAARGQRTGDAVPGTDGLVTVGSLKLISDGALNSGTALCHDADRDGGHGHAEYTESELRAILSDAHANGFTIALHAIGDLAVTRALDAFEATGAGGTIEHAQMVADADLPRFAALGIGAAVHPEHLLDDRDVTDRLWAGRTRRAFAYRALAEAGARLTFGSDAPVAPLDPWLAIAAAVFRTRDDREPWEPSNAVDVQTALAASWTAPGLAEGGAADLVVMDADPLAAGMVAMRQMPVALTVCAGRVTHQAL
ncbi:amidohydrolase [Demequina capsici]|uniref:Amidohydrolase family protein n=1 Tax=Demequina capsici TaxID=3075620 RepID=A0AA96F4R4_9MICO|nr:amidohydrolase family protein [Demequina sp. OYTSA14]WNM23724.1 amidohydrolase family protein [Demequina sp. OYTSA14]